ncbi:MAG: DegV family protein [Bacilli bacterium]|nr:DegV family protein [Bacilli bacterium]
MSKIKIICTSTSCLEYAPERYQKLGIDFIRVHVFFNGNEYLEGPELDPVKFYKTLENVQDVKSNLPHTAMPTREEICASFEKAYKEGYEEVIVVSLSSYLGGTWNFIRLTADDYREKFKTITVVDAKITCFQEGLLAVKAQNLANQGKSVPEILQELEWMKAHQEFFGVASRLDYMILNGRLKGGKAYLGKLMSICPVVQFNHAGELAPLTNAMGVNKAIIKMNEILLKVIGNRNPNDYVLYRAFTGNTLIPRQMKYEEMFKIQPNHENVIMSAVTGCHIGPWVIGYGYTPIRTNDEALDDVPDYYYEQNKLKK